MTKYLPNDTFTLCAMFSLGLQATQDMVLLNDTFTVSIKLS